MAQMVRRGICAVIRGYQTFLSPLMGHGCRFAPTCSHYTQDAVMKYGAAKGLWLGIKRISRCHPWSGPGGIDPVP